MIAGSFLDMLERRQILTGGAASILNLGASRVALSQPTSGSWTTTIGVLTDMSDTHGTGSMLATELAVADYSGITGGGVVKVVAGDHRDNPELGAMIARKWIDIDDVDMILDVPNSSIALEVSKICTEKNKVFIGSGVGNPKLTGPDCSANSIQWTYDTWSQTTSLVKSIIKMGGLTWYLLVSDSPTGFSLKANITSALNMAGGTIVGSNLHPPGIADFSNHLVTAQSSGADVLLLANSGRDTIISLQQLTEIGFSRDMKISVPLIAVNMIYELGLRNAQELLTIFPFYWNLNDGTREFARRFRASHPGRLMPNYMQAGCYSGTLHFLKAVAELGRASNGRDVVNTMKAIPVEDTLFGKGHIRSDGRKIHQVYLMKAKTAEESRGTWDFFQPVLTIPADEAFRPEADGNCPISNK